LPYWLPGPALHFAPSSGGAKIHLQSSNILKGLVSNPWKQCASVWLSFSNCGRRLIAALSLLVGLIFLWLHYTIRYTMVALFFSCKITCHAKPSASYRTNDQHSLIFSPSLYLASVCMGSVLLSTSQIELPSGIGLRNEPHMKNGFWPNPRPSLCEIQQFLCRGLLQERLLAPTNACCGWLSWWSDIPRRVNLSATGTHK
jgi:hypothetical protein